MRMLRSVILSAIPAIVVLVVIPYFVVARHLDWYHLNLGPARWLGAALVALGVAGYVWCVLDFVSRGHGAVSQVYTPTTLVITGPYKYSRNPAYVSYVLATFGEAIFFGSGWILLLAFVFLIRNVLFVYLREEPLLKKQFGADYEAYCQQVPRWIPRFSAHPQ